jgi:agmatine deiminase
MLWPFRTDNWRDEAKQAQIAFSNVAKAIGKFEHVKIGVLKELFANAQTYFTSNDNVTLEVFEYDDSWIRDSGPTYLLNDSNNIAGVHWKFNAWGGIYKPYELDGRVADRVLELTDTSTKFMANFILEGGSFHVDGEGTILTTEECLLNANRNPHLNKAEIEQLLLHYLGGEKVIWLKRGLVADEDTNGHIDNIACFSKPGEVLLSWTDDPSDPQYAISREAWDILSSTTDAKGRNINIVKLFTPPPMYYSEEDCSLLTTGQSGEEQGEEEEDMSRQPGERMAASYANFYIANGGVDANGVSRRGVVCPSFHPESDEHALSVLQTAFPGFEVVMVPGRDILLGGGNIHCITQQQPSAAKE